MAPKRGQKDASSVNVRPIRRFKKAFKVSNRAVAGDAPKDFVVVGDEAYPVEAYIAKSYRKVGPVESVTEAVFALLGATLPVKVAKSRLVRLNAGRIHPEENRQFAHQVTDSSRSDLADVRFMSRYFLGPNEELVHGVELVASWLGVRRQEMEEVLIGDKGDERAFYTVDVVAQVFKDTCAHGECPAMLRAFARMMAYDALTGANDRHPMNWGVIRHVQEDRPLRFAPVFDTARGLFWNTPEAELIRVQEQGRREAYIKKYADNSQPLLGCARPPPNTKLNHFAVIEYMLYFDVDNFSDPIRHVVGAFEPAAFRRELDRQFGSIMSVLRRGFIDELLRNRHAKLQDVIRRTR